MEIHVKCAILSFKMSWSQMQSFRENDMGEFFHGEVYPGANKWKAKCSGR